MDIDPLHYESHYKHKVFCIIDDTVTHRALFFLFLVKEYC